MSDFLSNPAMLFDVRGKVAIVTGASGAFGALAAKVLAGSGARLVLAGSNAASIRQVSDACKALGAEVAEVIRRPDTSEDCDAMVQAAADSFGGVDILVVASGMNDVALINEMEPERFDRVMQANVTGSWLIARSVATRLIEQGRGGKIVLTSSARGLLGHPAGYTAYCASKSAVDGIVRALGCELGRHGITANAIAPTVFRSDLTSWMFEDTERGRTSRQNILTRIPMGRLGEPQDLAGPLLFLCSSASDFYTGHILYADGGYTAG